MLSTTLKRALLETRSQLPPTFLLPWSATLTTTSTPTPSLFEPPPTIPISKETPRRQEGVSNHNITRETLKETAIATGSLGEGNNGVPLTRSTRSTKLPPSVKKLLPLMQAQSPHYITVHIHGHPYLITQGDTIRLPFLMHGVGPGDVIRLNRAINLGSRDYTLKASANKPKLKSATAIMHLGKDMQIDQQDNGSSAKSPGWLAEFEAPHFIPNIAKGKYSYIDDRLFVCRAVVTGVESEPMRIKEKTKRRQRHIKKAKSKHRYTILKIRELRVKSVDEVEAESYRKVAY